jgi:hypothetical protein
MNNNSIKLKNKYLKYKHKYIILKNQLFFTYDTKIKQIGGMGDYICVPNVHGIFESFEHCQASSEVVHKKSIYPGNIPQMNESKTYPEYVTHFLDYLDSNSSQLNDLWMIIGANNETKPAYREMGAYDLTRFGDEYDIAITQDSPIDFTQPKLLALYSSVPAETPNLYRRKTTIYKLLAEKLPEKFSKIIYDEGTTKFILKNNEIFNQLKEIEKLIALNGELYINTFKKAFKNLYLEIDETKQYYLTDFTTWHIDPEQQVKTIVTPQMEKTYLEYNKIQVIQAIDNSQGKYRIIYNLKALFKYMDSDGFISKEKIVEHLKEINRHFQIENDDHNKETVEKLQSIFSPEKYSIKYSNNIRYPNNQIEANTKDFRKIFNFYVIKREK